MEAYKVRITKQAKEHLILIRNYISTELKQPIIAKKIIGVIKAEIYSLEYMPHRIRCIDEEPWRASGFRRIRVKNYYIYFWINENKKEVDVIAIIYVKMNQVKQLEML